MPVIDPKALLAERSNAIRAAHRESGITRAELDVSGGVDSAVMLGLLVAALGPTNVTAIHIGINSSPDALSRAQEVCDTFSVPLIVLDATPTYNILLRDLSSALSVAGFDSDEIVARLKADPTILGSIRSTLRAPIGRAANRITGGGLRHGTGNEDEDRVLRFYQKGGDGEVDSNPIAMLSKGEVFQLAIALGVPRSILTARPSPDLWGVGEAHNDEDEIGAYLNLKGCGFAFYSYVDPDTGTYKNVGLIERLNRFLDSNEYGEDIFLDRGDGYVQRYINAAIEHPAFEGVPADIVETLVRNAKRVEKATRHKLNPNIPTFGSRALLVDRRILTDVLPTTVPTLTPAK